MDPVLLPDRFWERADVLQALGQVDIRALFLLVRQHAGASQTQIGVAVGMPQSQVSVIMSTGPRQRRVTAYEVLLRIADGLNMPDAARSRLASPVAADPVTPMRHRVTTVKTRSPGPWPRRSLDHRSAGRSWTALNG